MLDSLTKDEIHYQNAAYELIQGEIMYLRDLELIDKVGVMKSLLDPGRKKTDAGVLSGFRTTAQDQ